LSVTTSDNALIRALENKDRKAQKRVYEQYFSKMAAVPMRYGNSKDEAYSILNESFFKVFNSIKNYNRTGDFEGWIYKIVFNTTMDHVRKNLKHKKYQELDSCPEHTIVVNEGLDNLQVSDLHKLIQGLPNTERSVFSLFAIDGYKHKEIAKLLGISLGTSKWYLNSARKLLVASLKNVGYER